MTSIGFFGSTFYDLHRLFWQHVHVHVRHGLARELAVLHAELEAARLVPGLEHALHLAH